MKAETGAKRRLVLSMIGLAVPPDPDDAKNVRYVVVDGTGNVLDHPTQEQKALAADPNLARIIGEPVYEDADEAQAPLAGTHDQRATQAELTPPRPAQGQRPVFGASEEDVTRWRGAWFATVKGTSLDTDEARARYVAQWTADEWPKNKRTDSLTTMFKRATRAEAHDFLGHVRALADDERRSYLADADAAREQPQPRHPDQKVHDSVMLTGGPGAVADGADGDDQADQETAF
jgi:hypothetical protein